LLCKECAWSYRDGNQNKTFAVVEILPVDSPESAVKVATKLALTKRCGLIEISRPKHLKTLASRIERQLQTGEWMHCAIYEDELQGLWPPSEKD
jgi:hypothetical protein